MNPRFTYLLTRWFLCVTYKDDGNWLNNDGIWWNQTDETANNTSLGSVDKTTKKFCPSHEDANSKNRWKIKEKATENWQMQVYLENNH